MNNSNDSKLDSKAASGIDDMEQVRQLLLGGHQAAQERQFAALEDRVAQLEKLVDALIAHGDATRRAWQTEVAALKAPESAAVPAAREGNARSILQQVTPLTPRAKEAD